MTTEDDFQRALDANPDDWQTRLVFADWLEDRGDDLRLRVARLYLVLDLRDQPGVAPAWIDGVGVRGAYDF